MSKVKLAIPVENGLLSEHFGHTRTFEFFEIEDKKILNNYRLEPPPHEEGVIPRWLIENGVTDLLTGGIGPKAINILYNKGINVFVGVEKDTPDNLALNFINDSLSFGKNYCHH
ncbi:MAG: NifB/NifX family molybdenum-iron cluster-binding protein [Bacteroidales bacterium]|nr:NifB/NifX family molybdenum-iron cluster-binding protein [Bacteroidales bacterium]